MATRSAAAELEDTAERPARVLVVDDEPAITVALAKKMRREGHDCVTAGSGEEALSRLENYEPDLVISDVRMPGMSGIELLSEIKQRDPRVQVILITAYAEVDFVVQALRNGADDYLLKPFNLTELGESVSRALKQRRSLLATPELGAEGGVRPNADPWAMVVALAAAAARRDRLPGHVQRVAGYAVAVGRESGTSDERLGDLWLSAVCHELGKLEIAEELLRSEGEPDAEDRESLRGYPGAGARILLEADAPQAVIDAVRHHRERWDGSGYPDGLRGEEIPLAARIVAVCDAFDTMGQDRPYRSALKDAEAVKELQDGAGTQFDPEVVDTLLRVRADALDEPASRVGSLPRQADRGER